jgi:hypothetical protein
MDEIEIVVEPAQPWPRFRLSAAGGTAPLLTHVTVSEAGSRVVWCVATVRYSDEVGLAFVEFDGGPEPPEDERLDPLEDLPPSDPRHEAALQARLDPIEDLPPSDPRHRAALRRMQVDEDELQAPLERLEYGVVPPGFRQVHPPRGQAPPLVRGASYLVSAVGTAGSGTAVFRLE